MYRAIDAIEKHARCWYTIWGILGKRTYMGYSKKESERLYREEAKEKIFVNQPVKKKKEEEMTYKAKMIKESDVIVLHGNTLEEVNEAIGQLRSNGYDLLKVENVKTGNVIFWGGNL